jgi:hypothetical protein
VLIPLTWWTMYLVNRWQVATPVLGLIDEIAEKYGYWPVHTPEQSAAAKAAKEKVAAATAAAAAKASAEGSGAESSELEERAASAA